MNQLIRELCKEVDKTLEQKVDNPRLRELAVGIIADPKDLPPQFVSMAGDIHEIDTDTEPDSDLARNFKFFTLEEFLKRLQNIKDENVEFWN